MAEEELEEVAVEEEVAPADIQEIVNILESVKQKADLLEQVSEAVSLGKEAHDRAAQVLSVDDALEILAVLGVIAEQQRANLDPMWAPTELRETALDILLEVSKAHKRILSHINK